MRLLGIRGPGGKARDTRITVNSEREMDIFTIAISGDYIVMFVVSHDTIKYPPSRAGK